MATREIDWREYERRKAEIQKLNLSPDEYEKAIRELTEELDAACDDEEVLDVPTRTA
jgi:predicted metal-binding transcription factor (methanogenesis marker protein 9)